MKTKITTRLLNGEPIELKIEDDQFVETVSEAKVIKLNDDTFVSAGWIDMHVHGNPDNLLYSADVDEIGCKQGVVMVVDAGSTGKDNYIEYKNKIVDKKTKVKIFLNVSRKGIFAQSELFDLNNIDFDIEPDDFVVGYKIRMSTSVVGTNGIMPLQKVLSLKKDNLPIMVHIGNEPPLLSDYAKLLTKDFVVTHIFNGKNESLFKNGQLTTELKILINNGVKFDLGHGNESFNIKVASSISKSLFEIDTISSDIYSKNKTNGIVTSLAMVMSKMRKLDYEWNEILEMVTSKPAEIMKIKNWNLNVGSKANATFFKIVKEKITVLDSFQNQFELEEYIKPVAVLIDGDYIELEE